MSVQTIDATKVVAFRSRNDQTQLPANDATWHNVAIERQAKGLSLAPLNPFKEGEAYFFPLAVTESESRNRKGFWIYRVIGLSCDESGNLTIPGTGEITNDEKLASVSISVIPEDAIFADKHRKQVCKIVTTAGRSSNNTKFVMTYTNESGNEIHPLLAGKDAPVIEAFQKKKAAFKTATNTEPSAEQLEEMAKAAIGGY